MAISPVVQQLQMQKDITMAGDGGSATAQSFSQRFGEEAHRVFESRFPDLVQYISTFKIVDSDHQRGFGLGAFILWAGDNVVHVPVVMADGDISSCEMVYDKSNKLLSPLGAREVKRIEQANRNKGNTLAVNPMVENTTQIFSNMFRPPRSSNVVIASQKVDIAALPASAKAELVQYFNDHPEVLAKTAEFYPVKELAAKLAYSMASLEDPKAPEVTESTVLSVKDLLKTAGELSDEARSALNKDGFYIKESTFKGDIVQRDQLDRFAVDRLKATVIDHKWTGSGTGYLLATKGLALEKHRCCVSGNCVFTVDGMIRLDFCGKDNLVVTDYDEGITRRDLEQLGWSAVRRMPLEMERSRHVTFMVTTRHGGYKVLRDTEDRPRTMWVRRDGVRSIDNTVTISDGMNAVHAADDIDYGYLNITERQAVIPTSSFALVRENRSANERRFLSLGGLHRVLSAIGHNVSLVKDGPSFSLEANGTLVTEHSEVAIAKVASEALGLSHEEFLNLKKAGKALFYPGGIVKNAFLHGSISEETTKYLNEPVTLDNQQAPIAPPEDTIAPAAGIRDKDLMDLSMLAAVSANPDVKNTIMDSVSTFMEANSELGTTLLNMAVHEDEFERHYGSEEFVKLRSNMRNLFKQLGDMTNQLREFIVMGRL